MKMLCWEPPVPIFTLKYLVMQLCQGLTTSARGSLMTCLNSQRKRRNITRKKNAQQELWGLFVGFFRMMLMLMFLPPEILPNSFQPLIGVCIQLPFLLDGTLCPSAHCLYSHRVLAPHKISSCEITQWLFETFGRERSCVIEQEPFCGVRTHFYQDASSYHMFRDRRVVETLLTYSCTETKTNSVTHISKIVCLAFAEYFEYFPHQKTKTKTRNPFKKLSRWHRKTKEFKRVVVPSSSASNRDQSVPSESATTPPNKEHEDRGKQRSGDQGKGEKATKIQGKHSGMIQDEQRKSTQGSEHPTNDQLKVQENMNTSDTKDNGNNSNQKKEKEEVKGVLRLWDFGGQTEFYTTHHIFLNADAINIIVMDISKPLKRKLISQDQEEKQLQGIPETPEDFLCYWLRSIEMSAREKEIQPTVLLVLTHKDKVAAAEQGSYITTFTKDVQEIIRNKGLLPVHVDNIFVVDNKNGHATEFEQMRKCVKHLIEEQPSWGAQRPIRWLKLEADMKQAIEQMVQKPVKHLMFEKVTELAKVYQMDRDELSSCLLFLHSVGDLIWFSDKHLENMIILDPQWLVDVFKVLITSEQFLKNRKNRDLLDDVHQLLKHGVVSFNSLEKFWAGNDVKFLVEIMKRFDLILPFGPNTGGQFLVPSLLPPMQIQLHKAPILSQLHPVYTTEYRAEFEELYPIGTFGKLLAACSKSWPICEDKDGLSHTFAVLSPTSSSKLVLYQPHRSTIQVSIWCQLEMLQRHPLSDILGVTTPLRHVFHMHGIPPSELCQLVCPNWRPHYALFCITDALQESLDPDSHHEGIQYIRGECLCPNITVHL